MPPRLRPFRPSLPVLALLFLAGAGPATATAPEDGAVVISRRMCRDLFLIPLQWRGESGAVHDLTAVFDTGATRALIDPDAIERASGTRVDSGQRVHMENVSAGDVSFTKFHPRVRDLDHLSRAMGVELDVFLPFTAFRNRLLILDYAAGELRLARGSLPAPDGKEIFSARGPDSRPWLKVNVGGRTRRLLLDSGSNGRIAVRSPGKLGWRVEPLPLRLAQGMNEESLSPVGRLAGDLRIAGLTFHDPVVSITDDTELLGSWVLEKFTLTFDQENRRVRLQPRADGPVQAPPYRGTGALMRSRGDHLEIARVLPDSPADRAGLQEGDRVLEIDGVAADRRDCNDAVDTGKERVTMTLLWDGQRVSVPVAVEDLIP